MTKKVIIIDDNLTTLKIIQTAFRKRGWAAYGAKNVHEGFNLIYDVAPDIIIADAIMPIIGGFKFVRMLREDENISKIPTVVYSVIEEKNAKFYIKEELGEYFLTKSPDTNRLIDLSEKIIKKHQMSSNYKLMILKKGLLKKMPQRPAVEEKIEEKSEQKTRETPTTAPEIIKKEEPKKNLMYYAIVSLFVEDEKDFRRILNPDISKQIKEGLLKNEKFYKNENDEYGVIIYAKDKSSARQRLNGIIDIVNSIDNKIDISIGVVEYENNLDFDIEEAYDLAFEALKKTTKKEKTVIEDAK